VMYSRVARESEHNQSVAHPLLVMRDFPRPAASTRQFKTFGCGSAMASSSLATEWIRGKTIEECLELKNSDIAKHLKLPPVKLHCSMLAEDAIKGAIRDFQKKTQSQTVA
jgi:hypothetical protein